MSGTPGWLKGCGIGCGVAILISVILSVSATLWFRSQFSGVERAQDSREELVEALGDPEDHVPMPDGVLDPGRLRLFLELREALRPARVRLDSVYAEFPPRVVERGGNPVKIVFQVLKGVGGMVGPLGEYVEARNLALLEAGMGLGEYQHLYGLVYYAWLDHDPGEGPEARRGRRRDGPLFRGRDSTLGPEKAERRYRRLAMAQLDNLHRALADDPNVDPGWREAADAERRRFRDDPGAVAWRGALPPAVEAVLEPLRERLAATWHAGANPLEFPMGDDFHWEWDDD